MNNCIYSKARSLFGFRKVKGWSLHNQRTHFFGLVIILVFFAFVDIIYPFGGRAEESDRLLCISFWEFSRPGSLSIHTYLIHLGLGPRISSA